MPAPEGYETPEQIAVELGVPVSRVMRVAKENGIPLVSFPDDNRRRRFSPSDSQKVRELIKAEG